MTKSQIKNHLIELGKNLDSKDDLLIKTIIQTFVKKIIIKENSIIMHIRLFQNMDMAKVGGDETQHSLAISITTPKIYRKRRAI